MALTELGRKLGVEPSEDEGDHGAGAVRVVLRVGLVVVGRAVEFIVERIDLCSSIGEAAELGEGEGIVGEVGEVVVRLGEERELAGASDLVEDGSPRSTGRQVLEGRQLVAQIVQGQLVAQWIVDHRRGQREIAGFLVVHFGTGYPASPGMRMVSVRYLLVHSCNALHNHD